MLTESELSRRLEKYLPVGTTADVAAWIVKSNVHFRITMPRDSVYGDYTPAFKGKPHQITVNGNLNIFSFFVTTVHEFAHLYTFEKYGDRVKPHGTEWKEEYKRLMSPYLNKRYLPDDVNRALVKFMSNPAASSCTDHDLLMTLKRYDRVKTVYLEEIPEGERFVLQEMEFIKGKKRRTRYECTEVKTRSVYLIGQSAEINPVNSLFTPLPD